MTPDLMRPIDGEILPPGEGMVRVAARKRPFRMDCTTFDVPAGTTLEDMVAETIDPAVRHLVGVRIAGHIVPRENWRRVRPKQGTLVEIVAGAAGGGGDGGKSPLRTVLTIALIAATIYVGGLDLGIAFQSGNTVFTGAQLASAGVPIAGSLIVNAERAPALP